jgi:hypothetical protein
MENAQGAGFSILNSAEAASRDKQQEGAAEFANGDSIRRSNIRLADSRYIMFGIKHNKTIAAKTFACCLKSCAHLVLICLAGGLKLN